MDLFGNNFKIINDLQIQLVSYYNFPKIVLKKLAFLMCKKLSQTELNLFILVNNCFFHSLVFLGSSRKLLRHELNVLKPTKVYQLTPCISSATAVFLTSFLFSCVYSYPKRKEWLCDLNLWSIFGTAANNLCQQVNYLSTRGQNDKGSGRS